MDRYALVDDDSKVVNVIVLGDFSTWVPPDDLMLVEAPGDCEIGWTYQQDGTFTPPPNLEGSNP